LNEEGPPAEEGGPFPCFEAELEIKAQTQLQLPPAGQTEIIVEGLVNGGIKTIGRVA
jgi:hypothetical protein